MTFWIVTALMAALVSLLLVLTMLRTRAQTGPAAAFDLKVYRDQLKEVDRDLGRGVIAEADAERIRTEVSRRILAADAQMQEAAGSASQSKRLGYALSAVVFVALIGGSFVLYRDLGAPGYGDLALKTRIEAADIARQTRPDQAAAEASLPTNTPTPLISPQYLKLVEQLRTTVASRPNDLQGQTLLARNEAAMGNFVAAYSAQQQVLRLKGDQVTVSDLTDYGDMLIMAAGGYVSPEAESVLGQVLERDPANGPARYYYGLMLAQTGRPDQAFGVWDALLRDGPEYAPWMPPIRMQIEEMAALAGVNFTMPETDTETAARGPSAADIEAASEMSEDDRQAMIRNMVNGLSERLAEEGGPPSDWARLITALGVLGEQDRARAIYANAQEVFAGNAEALNAINTSASAAGITP